MSFQTTFDELILFNIIIYIQSHENEGLQDKFYRLELGNSVMERSSVTFACLPLLLFWFVWWQDLTSMAFWPIYFPCLKPEPKYLPITCLYEEEGTEISFCSSGTNTLGALGLLAWTLSSHNISEIATFPGYHWSPDTFPPHVVSEMATGSLGHSAWIEKLELVVCWKAGRFLMCSLVWFAITCLWEETLVLAIPLSQPKRKWKHTNLFTSPFLRSLS